jgi:hypothetical protein
VSDPSFTPTFHHTALFDGVDLVDADGPKGLNIRFKAVESDLQQMSSVVAEISTVLTRLTGPAVRLLSVPLALISTGGGGWSFDGTGAAHPASGAAGGTAVMNVALPDQVRLREFRVLGLFPGAPATLNIGLFRVALVTPAAPTVDTVAQIKSDTQVLGNPYDFPVPIADTALARVNNGSFRYFIVAAARSIASSDTTSLAAVQIRYSVL